MHHADPSNVDQTCRVGKMLESSTGELHARAAFMHHDDKSHSTVKHHVALKGLEHSSVFHMCNNLSLYISSEQLADHMIFFSQ